MQYMWICGIVKFCLIEKTQQKWRHLLKNKIRKYQNRKKTRRKILWLIESEGLLTLDSLPETPS